jgi:hypothetical protein
MLQGISTNCEEEKRIRTKNLFILLVAIMVEVVITYFVATTFTVRFIEVMFFTGLAFAAVSFYFSSSGGTISRFHSSQLSGQTGIIQKLEPFVFRKGPIFTASIIFFNIGLILFILLISGIIPPR